MLTILTLYHIIAIRLVLSFPDNLHQMLHIKTVSDFNTLLAAKFDQFAVRQKSSADFFIESPRGIVIQHPNEHSFETVSAKPLRKLPSQVRSQPFPLRLSFQIYCVQFG